MADSTSINKNSRPVLTDNATNWQAMPYALTLKDSKTFDKLSDVISYRTQEYGAMFPNGRESDVAKFIGLVNQTGDNHDELAYNMLGKPWYQNTTVGGNDAINCLWQFNRDDDIIHPITKTIDGSGLGRVYASTTQQNQRICWFTFGVPYFTKMFTFYKTAFDQDLVELNNKGFYGGDRQIGQLLGESIGFLISLPFLPIKFFSMIVNASKVDVYPVNKFYELRGCMQLYYRYVDSILGHWLVSTGMYGNYWPGMPEKDKQTMQDYVPDALKLTGCNIWEMLRRRALNAGLVNGIGTISDRQKYNDTIMKNLTRTPASYANSSATSLASQGFNVQVNESGTVSVTNGNTSSSSEATTDDIYGFSTSTNDTDDTSETGLINRLKGQLDAERRKVSYDEADVAVWNDDHGNWFDFFKSSMLGSTQFIGFRIDKSTDASESYSNSTSPSEMAQQYNSKVTQIAHKKMEISGGSIGDEGGLFQNLLEGITDVAKGTLNYIKDVDFLGISDLANAALSGAWIDIPEQYDSSSFSKSHAVSFQLRSPYGDLVSIYQSIIVPLACILAGSLPRAGGPNSYTQPFLTRIYCKGMFAVPMGIIDSVSIKRGDSEFGWTYDGLPTCVDVSISIKDMSPIMYLAIDDRILTHTVFGNDSSFQEYLLTLSGVGLFERISTMGRLQRNLQYKAHAIRNTYFNPAFWANSISQFDTVKVFGQLIPKTTVSHN